MPVLRPHQAVFRALFTLLLVMPAVIQANPGDLDSTFGTTERHKLSPPGTISEAPMTPSEPGM
jgi:hypothetical protein